MLQSQKGHLCPCNPASKGSRLKRKIRHSQTVPLKNTSALIPDRIDAQAHPGDFSNARNTERRQYTTIASTFGGRQKAPAHIKTEKSQSPDIRSDSEKQCFSKTISRVFAGIQNRRRQKAPEKESMPTHTGSSVFDQENMSMPSALLRLRPYSQNRQPPKIKTARIAISTYIRFDSVK